MPERLNTDSRRMYPMSAAGIIIVNSRGLALAHLLRTSRMITQPTMRHPRDVALLLNMRRRHPIAIDVTFATRMSFSVRDLRAGHRPSVSQKKKRIATRHMRPNEFLPVVA